MESSIKLDNLSFSYNGKTVLDGLTTSIAAGEFECLLGPNGTGKTTLAQVIAGELTPSQGRISLDVAEESRGHGELKKRIAYLPQGLQDPPFITCRELVSLGRFKPARSIGWRVSPQDSEAIEECSEKFSPP